MEKSILGRQAMGHDISYRPIAQSIAQDQNTLQRGSFRARNPLPLSLTIFFYTSHLGTAVASIHTRTHARTTVHTHTTLTPHVYNQTYNYTQIRRLRPSRDHQNFQGSVGDGRVAVLL